MSHRSGDRGVGAAIHGLHWSLDRIRSHSTGGDNRNVVADLAAPWTVVHLVLGMLLAVTIVLTASALVAMIVRLGQGFTIFG